MAQTHQSLYLKYRPQTFGELVGQVHVRETLKNAVKAGRISHAYLFCGPRGTGKTSTARILARAINCTQPQAGEPCGTCPNCQLLLSGRSLDLVELDAASNRRIDDIRDLREKIRVAPAQLPRKVYIIDEVHQLVSEAFNALLKTLEEPPDFAHLILCTTEPQKVPETIRSRCQRFDFRRVSTDDLARRLQFVAEQEGMTFEQSALYTLARAADGGMRDGLSMLEQVSAFSEGKVTLEAVNAVLGTVDTDFLLSLSLALGARNVEEVLQLVRYAVDSGKDIAQLLGELIAHFRDLLVLKSGASYETLHWPASFQQRFEHSIQRFETGELLMILDLLTETEKDLRWSTQHALLLEVTLVRILYALQGGQKVPAPSPRAAESTGPAPAARSSGQPAAEAAAPAPASQPPSAPETSSGPPPGTPQGALEVLVARLESQGEIPLSTMLHSTWIESDSPDTLVLGTDNLFCYEKLNEQWDQVEPKLQQALGESRSVRLAFCDKAKEPPPPPPADAAPAPAAQDSTVESVVEHVRAVFPGAQVVESPDEEK